MERPNTLKLDIFLVCLHSYFSLPIIFFSIFSLSPFLSIHYYFRCCCFFASFAGQVNSQRLSQMLQIEKLRDQLQHCNLVRPDTMWYCHCNWPCHFSCHCHYQNIHPRYWVEGNHTKLLQKPSHCTSMGPPSTTWQSLGFRNIPETAASTLWWGKTIKNMSKSTN